MKTLFMMKGLPASGKSTSAKEMLDGIGYGNAKIVNKDQLRLMLDDGHWTGANERFLLGVRDYIITSALNSDLHVIVDDTNLAPKHEKRLRELAAKHGALFEVIDFTHVGLNECIERDRRRQNYVGEAVIRKMYDDYLRPKPPSPPARDPALPDAVVVDLDGTLARMTNRGPFEWDKVYNDEPRMEVLAVVKSLANSNRYSVIAMSGRDECCRTATVYWLVEKANLPVIKLLMRPANDSRRDSIVKRELYEQHIKGKFNVVAIFDDRPQVITECWQSLGFTDRIFNVGDGRDF